MRMAGAPDYTQASTTTQLSCDTKAKRGDKSLNPPLSE